MRGRRGLGLGVRWVATGEEYITGRGVGVEQLEVRYGIRVSIGDEALTWRQRRLLHSRSLDPGVLLIKETYFSPFDPGPDLNEAS